MYERKILLGFVRVHILHHAAEENGIYGLEMIKELQHHGYAISPGTLYPILHEMEKNGMLTSGRRMMNGHVRKVYLITPKGALVLDKLKASVREMSLEILH